MSENYTTTSSCPRGSFEYTIKSGDTLFKLGQTYNTTVDAIMKLNPGINPNNLQIGQRICIPQAGTPPSTRCPVGTFAYTIKSGDTLYLLAIRYNTTVAAIMAVNPGINPNNLQIGQVICIPEYSTTPPQPRCPMGTFAYVIKAEDTLYMLAITYNTTVAAIMAVNPELDPNNLRVGQIICIPEEMPPSRCSMGTFEYTIKPGDTLYMLAQKYNTTVAAILAVNPGLDPNNLRVGQIICIPKSVTPPPECDGIYYVVRAGDTLYSIANLFNISVAKLMVANPGIDPNNLQIGQIICIPKEVPVTCPGGIIYTVGTNDTVGSIQLKFDISIMDLMAGNPNVNWDKLMPGQELCILPHKDRGCPCIPGTKSYVIVPADMQPNKNIIESVAKKFNTTVSTLLKINPNLAPNDFVVGARICVPKN